MSVPDPASPAATFARALATLERLETILQQETDALRSGDVTGGLAHAADKTEAAAAYRAVLADISRLSHTLADVPEDDLAELRRRHMLFERTVSLNLAVIATMRSVAEGILREVSDRMAPILPAAYGPPGSFRSGATAPITLSLKT